MNDGNKIYPKTVSELLIYISPGCGSGSVFRVVDKLQRQQHDLTPNFRRHSQIHTLSYIISPLARHTLTLYSGLSI